MQLTPTVAFRGMRHSDALESEIRTRITKLEGYYPAIIGCRVLVEVRHHHHEHGNHYHVRIDLAVPGEDVVIAHDANVHRTPSEEDIEKPTKAGEPEREKKDALAAIRAAFNDARRRLQDYARRQRGAIKSASRQPIGKVSQLFPIDEYGYIEAEDGHEVYFQKTSVLKDAFDRLAIGSPVSFVEESGEKGPQASTVKAT